MSLPSLVTFFAVIVAVIIGDVLCFGVQSSWPPLNNNNSNNPPSPSNGMKWGVNSKSTTTTPWPALGQKRNEQQNNQPINQNQPMWVRPNNGPNWVRTNPVPSRPSAGITNTNFLNNERNGVQNGLPNSNRPRQPSQSANTGTNGPTQGRTGGGGRRTPTVSRPMNTGMLVGGDGGKKSNKNQNNNNNMAGGVSTGSIASNSGAGSPNIAQEDSNTQEGGVEDYELREFSEELLLKDTNNAARLITVNLQGKTTSRSMNDEAPLPLLAIDSKTYSIPSIEKLMLLYNNYILESNQNEVYTAQEKIEENNLLDTILSTPVMQHTRNFLIKKGKLGRDPKEFKDLLRAIWFGMYSRGQGRIGSSGFEHVFLAELKNNQVSGLHNWLYFNEEEKKNMANYLGYMKKIDLGTKGSILKYHFTFHGIDKPVGSMFIGTSPELEIALYSTCFVLRPDRICPLKMDGNKFIIRTYTYRYRGKNMIGSAFPEI